MSYQTLVEKEYFWNILTHLENLQFKTPIEGFLDELDVSEEQFNECLQFIQTLDFHIKIELNHNGKVIVPPVKEDKIRFDLAFSEWLALQAHIPEIQEDGEEKTFTQKILEFESLIPENNLTELIKCEEEKVKILSETYQDKIHLIQSLETSSRHQYPVEIDHRDDKNLRVYVHRLVFLDGSLCLIGEEMGDRCLIYLKIDEVNRVTNLEDKKYVANFSQVEVNDFIYAIRSVSGTEIRLVLKVRQNSAPIDLNPPYHFLGNPYVTVNNEGEMIWAASVEKSESLFDWLYSIHDSIEILDPKVIIEEFQRYTIGRREFERKSFKKAS